MMIYLATNNGLVVCERNGEWHVIRRGLEGKRVTSVIAREGVVLAGCTDGIFRSDDDGKNWREASQGLSHRHIRWLAYHPDVSDLEFAGTEPAAIFVSRDGGDLWKERPEVAELRNKHSWSLPYSREAGCVRGFAFHGSRGYAAVEVGGVLRSDDHGESWSLAEGSDGNPSLEGPPASFVYPDVHSIHVHPSSPDIVDAPTGGGFYLRLTVEKHGTCFMIVIAARAGPTPQIQHIFCLALQMMLIRLAGLKSLMMVVKRGPRLRRDSKFPGVITWWSNSWKKVPSYSQFYQTVNCWPLRFLCLSGSASCLV